MTNESVCIVLSAGLEWEEGGGEGEGRKEKGVGGGHLLVRTTGQVDTSEQKQALQWLDSFPDWCTAVALITMNTMQSDMFQNYF